MNDNDLFTAPQVARICSTDLKTIHNWVSREKIKSFRTPGRHLRFRRQDIVDFLVGYGYPIPEGFSSAKERVVLLENNETQLKAIKRSLARDYEVDGYTDSMDAMLAIGRKIPSLVLLGFESGSGDDTLHMVARLTAQKLSCPIAVYGAKAEKFKAAEKAGASDCILSKDGKEIKKRISTLLQR